MKRLYAVRDRKAESFGPIMSYAHEAVAVREFSLILREKESMISRFPADYELVYLGVYFDDGSDVVAVRGDEARVVITAEALVQASGQGELQLVKEA